MPALLGPILLQTLTLSMQDRTAVRARLFQDEAFYDASTSPGVELGLNTTRTSWTLGYFPTFTLDDLGSENEFTMLHSGSASAGMRWRRHFLTLSQQGGYGRQNLLAAPLDAADTVDIPDAPAEPTDAPAQQVQLANQVVEYGFSSSSLNLTHVLTRRLSLSEFVNYSTSSGFDDFSRSIYPLQREISGGPVVGYSLTRSDTLFTRVEGRYVMTGPVDAIVVLAEERWSKQIDSGISTELGAGVAYSQSRLEEDGAASDPERQVLPVATAALRVQKGRPQQRDTLQLTTQVTADVDRTTGEVDHRVLWGVLSEHRRERVTLSGSTSGSQSLSGDSENSLTSVAAGVQAAYALTPELSVDAGVSANYQRFAGQESLPLFWTGVVGLSYRMSPHRF